MIPKISNGETFGGIANYANDIKDKNTTVLASNGVDLRNNYTIAQSFKVQAKMNPGLKTCVGHFSLAFSPEDAHRCTDAFMRKLAMEYMKKMGISDTQYVIFRHRDHDHDHVHVVYNRVNNSGYTISDGCDVERAIAICQAMTREYGLHWGQGKENVNRNRLKGKAKVKYAIYDAAQEVLADTKTWAQFIKRMNDAGIEVKLIDRGKGKTPGIVFTKDHVSFAGGKVDKSLTFGSLFWKLCFVGDVLPKGVESPGEHVNHSREVLEERERLGLPPIGEHKRESQSIGRSLSSSSGDSSSDFFDTDAIAETASKVQDATLQVMLGPTTIAPSVGGGGGGSSKGWGDDDDDDEKKKKKNQVKRGR